MSTKKGHRRLIRVPRRHLTTFRENLGEVNRLVEIHEELTGTDVGRRHGVEILNKSAVVLLVATWEAFIEDLAAEAFECFCVSAAAPDQIPNKLRAQVATRVIASSDESEVWNGLAGTAWRDTLRSYGKAVLDKHVKQLNTPGPVQIDSLFEKLLGLRSTSSSWHWPGMAADSAKRKLRGLLDLRGEIAHRAKTQAPVRKNTVRDRQSFILRLARETHRHVESHVVSCLRSRRARKKAARKA